MNRSHLSVKRPTCKVSRISSYLLLKYKLLLFSGKKAFITMFKHLLHPVLPYIDYYWMATLEFY